LLAAVFCWASAVAAPADLAADKASLLKKHGHGSQASPAAAITGVYWAPNPKDGKVAFWVEPDGELKAQIIAIKPQRAQQKDVRNPDRSQRDQLILGSIFLEGFYYDAKDGRWEGGKLYDCKAGEHYSGHLWLNDSGNIEARGYIMIPLFGKDTTFLKVHSPEPLLPRPEDPKLVYFYNWETYYSDNS
jgi:uncharacterized protein (DUF2147 family)